MSSIPPRDGNLPPDTFAEYKTAKQQAKKYNTSDPQKKTGSKAYVAYNKHLA